MEYYLRLVDNRISNCGMESKLYMIPGATELEQEKEKVMV
jgi:hypothetical protein